MELTVSPNISGVPHETAKLLKDVEKSYDKGVKLLDASIEADKLAAEERGVRYRRGREGDGMRSLFDMADGDERATAEVAAREQNRRADEAVDEYASAYAEYLDRISDEEAEESVELVEQTHDAAFEAARGHLEEFYRDNGNSETDARKMARDMLAQTRAEVVLAQARKSGENAERPVTKPTGHPESGTYSSASGEKISFGSQGGLRRLGEGEFALVERRFVEDKNFDFTGKERIESADDVAYIFRSLENFANEHVFGVLVKDGRPFVVHIGMGTFNMSSANGGALRAAYNLHGADDIYLVHNHPSGKLQASVPDENLFKQLTASFEGEARFHSLIIDTTSGKYLDMERGGAFDGGKRLTRDGQGSGAVKVFNFDAQEYSSDFDSRVSEPLNDVDKVAAYISTLRLGDRNKVSYLVIDNQGRVVANIHTDFAGYGDSEAIAKEMASGALAYGGTRVVAYGNVEMTNMAELSRGIKQRSAGSVGLMDALEITNGIKQASAWDGGMFESEAEYGHAAEDLKRKVRAEVGEYARKYPCAPTEVIGSEADIDALELPIRESNLIKNIYRERETIAFFNQYDKKIYIFADRNSDTEQLGGTLVHENIHALIDKERAEITELLNIFASKVSSLPDEGGAFGVIYNGLKAGTHKSLVNEEFMAYTLEHAHDNKNIRIRVAKALSEDEFSLLANKILNKIYGQKIERRANEGWHIGIGQSYEQEAQADVRQTTPTFGRDRRSNESAGIIDGKDGQEILEAWRLGKDANVSVNPRVDEGARGGLGELRQGDGRAADATGGVGTSEDMAPRLREGQGAVASGETPEAKREHALSMSKKFNTPIRIVEDPAELTHVDPEMQKRMRGSKGFYNPATGEVVVVVPNNATVEDVAETVFHEVVAHKGLREIIGEENYDTFCDEVYDHLKGDLKSEVETEATRIFMHEPKKGFESARRKAMDEKFGRLSEKGFEDFTEAERGIWAKLKAKVLEAINKFLGSLKLPKWVRLGDNELRYMLWRSHERLRGQTSRSRAHTAPNYVDMARDVAKRQELGLEQDVAMRRGVGHKKMSNTNEARLNDLDPADVEHSAKVAKKIEATKSELKQLAKTYREVTDPKGFLTDLGQSLGAVVGKSGSGYRTFELMDGSIVKVRISTHNANAEHAKAGEPVVSIVIKPKRTANTFVDEPGKKVSEYVYFKEELRKAPVGTLSKIAEGLSNLLETGKYEDATGLARENHSEELRFRDGETGDIWKDMSVGLEERITNAAIRLANNQSGDLMLRNDAMRAVANNLQGIRRAMSAQRRQIKRTDASRRHDTLCVIVSCGY